MTVPMKAIEVYEDIGPAYQVAFDRPPAQIRSVQWLLNQLPPASEVVDIGCGTGRPVCEMLAEAGHHVTGVDFSSKMVETAKKQVPSGNIVKGDALSWEPAQEDQPFDAVTCYFAFLGGTKQQDSRDFFQRAFSWLKPGGVFIFGLVPLDWEEVEITWLGRRLVTSTLSAADARASIQAAGFEIKHEESAKFKPKAVEAGLCKEEEIDTETHLFLYARKPRS